MSQEKKDYAIQVNNLGLTIKKDTILSDVNIKSKNSDYRKKWFW